MAKDTPENRLAKAGFLLIVLLLLSQLVLTSPAFSHDAGGDARYVSGDARYVSGDARYVSGDATYVSVDARYVSGDARYVSGDARYVSGDARYVSGDARYVSGDARYVSGDARYVSGDARYVSGDARYVSGDARYVSGDARYVSGDAALAGMYLPFTDQPLAPTIESEAYIDFTLGSGRNAETGLTRAASATGYLMLCKNGDWNAARIDLTIDQLDYNGTGYDFNGDGLGDILVKAKFHLKTPFTNADLDRTTDNLNVSAFSFDQGELNVTLFNTGRDFTDSHGHQNYEAFGRAFFYGTYSGDDKVLVTDFSNQMSFEVPGIGDSCHLLDDQTFHLEGDVFCYPGGNLMGWQDPLIWSNGDQTLGPDDESLTMGYMCNYMGILQFTKEFCLKDGNGNVVGHEISMANDYSMPVTLVKPSAPGEYTGYVTAYPADGYVGAVGYKHFVVTVTNDIQALDVGVGISTTTSRTIVASTGFTPLTAKCTEYAWDWGDGTTDSDFIDEYTPGWPLRITFPHTYERPGVYEVTFRVLDASGQVIARKSYAEAYAGGVAQQYVGVTGLGPISKMQDVPDAGDNIVRVRADFIDAPPMGTYTAIIDWGDGTASNAWLYGANNRLVSGEVEPLVGGMSGKVWGTHIYTSPGQYVVTMTLYRETGNLSSVFGVAQVPVTVNHLMEMTEQTQFMGSLTEREGISDVFYRVDWGDGVISDLVPYSGGTFTDQHVFVKGGLFYVNVSFWYMPPGTTARLISYWQLPAIGCIEKGMDISVGETLIMRGDTSMTSREISTSDTFTAAVDFPTNLPTDRAVYGVFYWGDDDSTTVTAYPDENGVVHLEDSHSYSVPGVYIPRVDLLLGTDNKIGVGYSGVLDLSPRLGSITVDSGTVSQGTTVNAKVNLPFDTSALGDYGTDWTAVWHWESDDVTAISVGEPVWDGLNVNLIFTSFNVGGSRIVEIRGLHKFANPGHFRVRLDLMQGDTVISSSVFDEVEVV